MKEREKDGKYWEGGEDVEVRWDGRLVMATVTVTAKGTRSRSGSGSERIFGEQLPIHAQANRPIRRTASPSAYNKCQWPHIQSIISSPNSPASPFPSVSLQTTPTLLPLLIVFIATALSLPDLRIYRSRICGILLLGRAAPGPKS